ncbi:MAG: Do family serine endopeptidase [Planctomycetes bacterium]|nr:Do family serine endopeptidase [Planctomycetota bacterium]
MKRRSSMAVALSFGLLTAGLLIGGPSLATPASSPSQDSESDIPDIIERAAPAVVSVYASRPFFGRRPFWWPVPPDGGADHPPFWERDQGSGVIVDPQGLILTNNHVIERATEIRVQLSDRREFSAKIIGSDRRTDLALLRIDAADLPTLRLGDSSKVRVGETVLAIGNPLGMGQTVSQGILSAKGRANIGIAEYEDFLQTDASINPGNSGGALINRKGELIGVNTAIASLTGRFEGIGFAIPADMARDVMGILLREGRVSRGQMGVLVQDMTPPLARAMKGAPEQGVLVSDVLEGSPADKAGLRRGDVIINLNGEPVATATQLRNRVALRGAGTEIRLDVWRDGASKEIRLRLRKEEEPAPAERSEREEKDAEERSTGSGLEGIQVAPVAPELLRRRGLPGDVRGLVITKIDPAKASAFSGLTEGDIIVEVDRAPVTSVEQMRRAIQKSDDVVLLTLRREEGMLFAAVPKP